jgi:hypothetical protein
MAKTGDSKTAMTGKNHKRMGFQEGLMTAAALLAFAASASFARAQDTPSSSADAAEDPTGNAKAAIVTALPRGKKLILSDGSYQVVREYEKQGDRVRYYSLERSAWEEIPVTLVDWQATDKAEAEQQAQQGILAQKSKAADAAALARALDVDASMQVRPGVFLPDEKGFYLVDGNQVVTVELTRTVTHLDKGRAIEKMLSGVSIIPDKRNVDIPGKSAKLRVHTAEPEFYFRPSDGREPQLTLMRVQAKGDKREMMATSTNVVGTDSYKRDEVSMTVWDAARGLYRFTVDQALTPGEYAILENTPDGTVADYVWDFGVDTGPKTAGGKSKG